MIYYSIQFDNLLLMTWIVHNLLCSFIITKLKNASDASGFDQYTSSLKAVHKQMTSVWAKIVQPTQIMSSFFVIQNTHDIFLIALAWCSLIISFAYRVVLCAEQTQRS